jgi:DNA-directed RNA polymerase
MSYTGGYLLLSEPLFRGFGPNAHTANDLSQVGLYPTLALDLIQETPWQVNPFILDTVNRALETGAVLDGVHLYEPLSPHDDPYEPAMVRIDPEVWKAMKPVDRKPVVNARRRCLEKFDEVTGAYRSTTRTIKCANEMAQFERFYFPHNFDFRGRAYPIPSDMTPQGDDLAKGLLRFSRGTRLGFHGVFWMGVTVASHFGEDKLSMHDRYDFAVDHDFMADCEKWVDDPLKHRGWLKADAPFQFLAVAHEWVWAWRSGDPEAFVSRLPGNLDGSCNGAQHLSIMSRDLRGATATNCRSLADRHDLYMEVGDLVWEQVQTDAGLGNPLAVEWYQKMAEPSARRGVVKRAVMTVPYGVTERGIADFMVNDGHVDGMEQEWESAKYMRDLIWAAIQGIMPAGKRLQEWFSTCAQIVAEAGMPLQWDTPAGLKVTQAYRNLIEKRVQTLNTRFVVYAEPEENEDKDTFVNRVGMNVKKMGTSAPPNVVHSLDAAHMQITVVRMGETGIRDFSMIHDSFGCPFANVGTMRDILRQSAVDMYREDYLMAWKRSVEGYSGVQLPNPPERGEFDITEILTSEFFFS